jgi:hypothetical protein
VKSGLPREAYTFERGWPALSDARADVRRFGVVLARAELRRWNAQSRVYELAESNAKEVRNVAHDALVHIGEADADPHLTLKLEELDAAQIFMLTESTKRPARELALELIRKHYAQIGGAERLGWLMQSADRELGLFAVALLWEKHRPRGLPAQWKPGKGTLEQAEPFEDAQALRGLLRRLMFMVPPVRSADALDRARARKLSASAAKQRVLELVCEFAQNDSAFATLVAPVFAEFTGSVAKGEWQKSLSALLTLRRVHGLALEKLVP